MKLFEFSSGECVVPMFIESRSRVSLMLGAWLEREDTLVVEKKLNEQKKGHNLRLEEVEKKERRMKDELSLNNFSPWNHKR